MRQCRISPLVACVLTGLFLFSTSAAGNIDLPDIISTNMVIQGDAEFLAWGQASPSESIQVDFRSDTWNTVADAQGQWEINMGVFNPGGPDTMTFTGNNVISVTNVLVGEVWLGSGQSNMVFEIEVANNATWEIANANYPEIRLFTVQYGFSSTPLDEVTGTWVICSPTTVPTFSAVLYFFGREIHQQLNRPVGLIQSAVGSTRIETWMSEEALTAIGMKRDIAKESEYYNAMIHGIMKYRMKGVLWYQGESNGWYDSAYQEYEALLPAWIDDWRTGWNDSAMAFLIVQLPNWRNPPQITGDAMVVSPWAVIRNSQLYTVLDTTNTGLAVTIDIGDADDIHPKNKQDVGYRLALNARYFMYGEAALVYSGPIIEDSVIEDNAVRLYFGQVGSGLVTLDSNDLEGFAVADAETSWYWADASLDGDTVLVNCPYCPDPKRVRYAWHNNPVGNLGNTENLPASPFEDMVTTGRTYTSSSTGTSTSTSTSTGSNDTETYHYECMLAPGMTWMVAGMMCVYLFRKKRV